MKKISFTGKIRQVQGVSLMLAIFIFLTAPVLANAQAIVGMELQKIPTSSFGNPGTEIEVVSRVTNSGSEVLSGIVVEDLWPDTFIVNGQAGAKTAWSVPGLNVGESQSQTYKVTIPANALFGRYTFITKATAKSPFVSRELEYSFDVREVKVLATSTDAIEIPETAGFGRVDLIGLIIIIQLIVAAIAAFNLAKHQSYEQ